MSSSWPPPNGPTSPRVPRDSAILVNYASATVDAPASQVFSAILDTSTYSDWNSFVPSATILSQPEDIDSTSKVLHKGTSFTYHVRMQPVKKPNDFTDIQLRVIDISTPEAPSDYISQSELDSEDCFSTDLNKTWRVVWVAEGGFASRGLKTERFHEIVESDERRCEVRTWECQGGILARAVKYWYKDVLKARFQDWCDDLKKYCERDTVKADTR